VWRLYRQQEAELGGKDGKSRGPAYVQEIYTQPLTTWKWPKVLLKLLRAAMSRMRPHVDDFTAKFK